MHRHNGVILLRDESTQRHRFTLKHKHNIGTDLEAPVVWLLLEGEERKTKSKGDRRGAGGVKEGEKEGLSVRLFFPAKCHNSKTDWLEPEQREKMLCHSVAT